MNRLVERFGSHSDARGELVVVPQIRHGRIGLDVDPIPGLGFTHPGRRDAETIVLRESRDARRQELGLEVHARVDERQS